MQYGKGSILLTSRAQFTDGSYDPHYLRPAMLALASDDISNETYFLLITSQVERYIAYPDEYFLLGEDLREQIRLRKPSLIKLDKVHKGKVSGNPTGGLPPQIYKAVIKKLGTYKEKHPDIIYDEIKSKLF